MHLLALLLTFCHFHMYELTISQKIKTILFYSLFALAFGYVGQNRLKLLFMNKHFLVYFIVSFLFFVVVVVIAKRLWFFIFIEKLILFDSQSRAKFKFKYKYKERKKYSG